MTKITTAGYSLKFTFQVYAKSALMILLFISFYEISKLPVSFNLALIAEIFIRTFATYLMMLPVWLMMLIAISIIADSKLNVTNQKILIVIIQSFPIIFGYYLFYGMRVNLEPLLFCIMLILVPALMVYFTKLNPPKEVKVVELEDVIDDISFEE